MNSVQRLHLIAETIAASHPDDGIVLHRLADLIEITSSADMGELIAGSLELRLLPSRHLEAVTGDGVHL